MQWWKKQESPCFSCGECQMEVACGHCGGIINRNYKNSTSVKWLKNATSDWRYTKEYGNICPNCLRELNLDKEHG